MGWASGTELVTRIATRVLSVVDDSRQRRKIYEELVEAATDLDWDCLDEAEGIDPVLDEILRSHYDEGWDDEEGW